MKTQYSDIIFHACHDELFAIKDSYWESNLKGIEVEELATKIGVELNQHIVNKNYGNTDSIEIFHNSKDRQSFLYFDSRRDPTDQNDMLFFGIRFLRENNLDIVNSVLKIYNKLKTSSPCKYDKWGYTLYRAGKFSFEREKSQVENVNHHNQ